jgi:RNA polymerase sigma-70 factor (ECF subfamily)
VTVLPADDEQLLRQLYTDHAGVLLAYVNRLVDGDTARAEDVVQETLLRAWRHPEAVGAHRESVGSVRGWLLTVARNLVIDQHRARRSRPAEVAGLDAVAAVPVTAPFEQVLVSLEVADALQSLSPEHRAVIVQLYYRDCTVAEAAARLGVPEGTVKSRAYYALRALRLACEEREVLP